MPRTYTGTATHTHTRTWTVSSTYLLACRLLLPAGGRAFGEVIGPALELRAIAALRFEGENPETGCQAEFRLVIDWERHDEHRRASVRFRTPDGWTESVPPTVRRAVLMFFDLVQVHRLRVHGVVTANPRVPLPDVLARLRRKPRASGERASAERRQVTTTANEFDEFTCEIGFTPPAG